MRALPWSAFASFVVTQTDPSASPLAADRRADIGLIAVHGGGVHVSVAGAERRLDRHMRELTGRDLEDAEAELGDGAPIAEGDGWLLRHPPTLARRG